MKRKMQRTVSKIIIIDENKVKEPLKSNKSKVILEFGLVIMIIAIAGVFFYNLSSIKPLEKQLDNNGPNNATVRILF